MRIYIVQKGDTLQTIAKSHDVSVDEVIRLNSHISDPAYIVPGMKITLPNQPRKQTQKEEKAPAERPPKARATERPFGSVEKMNDRGSSPKKDRIPLTYQHQFKTSPPKQQTNPSKKQAKKSKQTEEAKKHQQPLAPKNTHRPRPDAYEKRPDQPRYAYEPNRPHSFNPYDDVYSQTPYYPPCPHPHYVCPYCMQPWHMHATHYPMHYPDTRDERRRHPKKDPRWKTDL